MKIKSGKIACFMLENTDRDIEEAVQWMKEMLEEGYDVFSITAKHSTEVLENDS